MYSPYLHISLSTDTHVNYTPIFFNSTGTRIQQKYYIIHQNFIPSPYPIVMTQLVGSVFKRTPSGSTQPSDLPGSSQTGFPIAQHP